MADIFVFPLVERILALKDTNWKDVYYHLDIENDMSATAKFVTKFKEIKEF